VHFFYDFYPIMVEYSETKLSFLQFLTSIFAIVGGVFTISRSAPPPPDPLTDANPPFRLSWCFQKRLEHRLSTQTVEPWTGAALEWICPG
jgi:hypothetical protein